MATETTLTYLSRLAGEARLLERQFETGKLAALNSIEEEIASLEGQPAVMAWLHELDQQPLVDAGSYSRDKWEARVERLRTPACNRWEELTGLYDAIIGLEII